MAFLIITEHALKYGPFLKFKTPCSFKKSCTHRNCYFSEPTPLCMETVTNACDTHSMAAYTVGKHRECHSHYISVHITLLNNFIICCSVKWYDLLLNTIMICHLKSLVCSLSDIAIKASPYIYLELSFISIVSYRNGFLVFGRIKFHQTRKF
jgi:hypothetical protein